MKACVNILRLQKAGNADSEYEDSFWPPKPCEDGLPLPLRVAVADGATDAVYSGMWANILVRSWGRRRIKHSDFLEGVRKKARIWQRMVRHRPMPWYVEEKARLGAYAAFVGVDLDQTPGSSSGNWSAIACGDCCLFHIRGSELLTPFPVSRSSDFSSSPLLLRTNSMNLGDLEGVHTATGRWEEGDCLYLMSDALACWFLGKCELGPVPWQLLSDITLAKEPAFQTWVNDLRRRHELKNDDCTLVSVTFE